MALKIDGIQSDALREAETIGAGNAATALSQLVGRGIGVEVPKVEVLSLEKASVVLGKPEELVTVVFLQLLGDASGVLLCAFKKDDANRLADILQKKKEGTTKILNEMGQSAVKEAATILCGAYLSAMSKLLNMKFLMSTPALAQDMAGAIIDAVLAETSRSGEHAIVVNTELSIVSERLLAYFMFIPEVESLDRIFKALGV